MKFKVGDRVKIIKDKTSDSGWIGKTGEIVPHGADGCITWGFDKWPYLVKSSNGYRPFKSTDMQLIQGETTMKDAKYRLQYMRIVEFFKTKKEAQKRIEQLLDDSEVDKTSIRMFEVGKVWEVNRPVSYELVEV